MARFAILIHDHPFLHWDLLLEWGTVARTWRLLGEPQLGLIDVEHISDHRLFYLDYSGPVSGGRGTVARWDYGTYEVISTTGCVITLILHGTRLRALASIGPSRIQLSPLPATSKQMNT